MGQTSSAFTLLSLNGFASQHGPVPQFYFDPLRNYNGTVTINGNATTSCPAWITADTSTACGCPPGDETVFNTTSAALYAGAADAQHPASLFMNSQFPQNVYITTSGLVKYTQPHEQVPLGGQQPVFTSTPFDFDGLQTFLLGYQGSSTAFYACHAPNNSVTKNLYNVHVKTPAANLTGCLPFSAIAVPYNATYNEGWTKNGLAAWEYD